MFLWYGLYGGLKPRVELVGELEADLTDENELVELLTDDEVEVELEMSVLFVFETALLGI